MGIHVMIRCPQARAEQAGDCVSVRIDAITIQVGRGISGAGDGVVVVHSCCCVVVTVICVLIRSPFPDFVPLSRCEAMT